MACSPLGVAGDFPLPRAASFGVKFFCCTTAEGSGVAITPFSARFSFSPPRLLVSSWIAGGASFVFGSDSQGFVLSLLSGRGFPDFDKSPVGWVGSGPDSWFSCSGGVLLAFSAEVALGGVDRTFSGFWADGLFSGISATLEVFALCMDRARRLFALSHKDFSSELVNRHLSLSRSKTSSSPSSYFTLCLRDFASYLFITHP
mmetsp:Transcript_23000/g.92078  ORF Transcript_23000/g.92078 Transcript_23000/m.92078 type:complete len:202 (-) Transcript_23000:332-937(-)